MGFRERVRVALGVREVSEDWMKPSEALRRIAEAKDPEIRPMTSAEKDRVVRAGSVAVHDALGHKGPIEECGPCTAPIPPLVRYEDLR